MDWLRFHTNDPLSILKVFLAFVSREIGIGIEIAGVSSSSSSSSAAEDDVVVAMEEELKSDARDVSSEERGGEEDENEKVTSAR